MLTRVFCLMFLLLGLFKHSNTQNLYWVTSYGSSGIERGNSLCSDSLGNVYATGFFSSTCDFDPGNGVYNMTNSGQSKAYITKLNSNGFFVWAIQLGGLGYSEGVSLKLDRFGNLIIGGTFNGTIDFDPGPGVFNISSVNQIDFFILKLDTSGNFIWAKSVGGTSSDYLTSITLDPTGSISATGFFKGTVDFDPGPGLSSFSSNGNLDDVFILKLDSGGNYLWCQQIGSTDTDYGWEITTDINSNLYVTGQFAGLCDFDPGTGQSAINTNGGNDIFILKLDPSGNYVWALNFGNTQNDAGASITTNLFGDIFVTGAFRSTIDFDPGTGIYNLNSSTNQSAFILKLTGNGTFLWAKALTGTGFSIGQSITLDRYENVYTTGNFNVSIDFDPGPGSFTGSAIGAEDIFISKLDLFGNFSWAGTMGGPNYDQSLCIDVDPFGSILTTGDFQTTCDFVPDTSSYLVTSLGTWDAYVHKLIQPTLSVLAIDNSISTKIFPNPMTESATLMITGCGFKVADYNFELFDIQGKLVKQFVIRNPKSEITRDDLAPGIYFYKISAENELLNSGKLIIQ